MERPSYTENMVIEKSSPPISNNDTQLPFQGLQPILFEKLCYDYIWEVEKKDNIFAILPIGTQGQAQLGADIFVKKFDNGKEYVSLYEVKRVKKYSLHEYKKAVTRFLEHYEEWGYPIAEFVLISSNVLSAREITEWQRTASELSEDKNISYKIVSSTELDQELKKFPEIVYKYFHPAWVEQRHGERGLWHLKKYGVYGYKETAFWNCYSQPSEECYDNRLIYINDHVRVDAFLPTLEKSTTCCNITLRNGKFSHIIITLSHAELITRYFRHTKMPIEERKLFLIKDTRSNAYFADIGSCRLELSQEEIVSLCDALDLLWDRYRSKIEILEEKSKSRYFIHWDEANDDIPLLRMNRGLWALLQEFAKAHDAFDTQGEWSIFDSGSSLLKVYTSKKTKHLDPGYHALIMPKSTKAYYFTNYTQIGIDNEVILSWQPPSPNLLNEQEKLSPRRYWDAKTTHHWIRNTLIPKALKWDQKSRKKESVFSFLKKNMTIDNEKYIPDNFSTSFFKEKIDIKEIEDTNALYNVVCDLQSFFNGNHRAIHIDQSAYKKLYEALSEVLSKNEIDDFSYFIGNLSYLSAYDMNSLIVAIEEHAEGSSQGCSNTLKIDCVLRCILVALRDGQSFLNYCEILGILDKLNPLISLMEKHALLDRQQRFLD